MYQFGFSLLPRFSLLGRFPFFISTFRATDQTPTAPGFLVLISQLLRLLKSDAQLGSLCTPSHFFAIVVVENASVFLFPPALSSNFFGFSPLGPLPHQVKLSPFPGVHHQPLPQRSHLHQSMAAPLCPRLAPLGRLSGPPETPGWLPSVC